MIEWKDIKGFEGLYQVSRCGKVKSIERFNPNSGRAGMLYPERELQQKTDKYGYKIVRLGKDGKQYDRKVHRLVLSTFDDVDIMTKQQVNHIDGSKDNNHYDNLEWCDNAQNQRHRGVVLRTGVKGVGIPIVTIDENGNKLEFACIKDGAEYWQIPNRTFTEYSKNGKIHPTKKIKIIRKTVDQVQ